MINLVKFGGDQYLNAMSYFLDVVVKHFMVPGKIENWIFLMDTKNLGLSAFPFKALGAAIKTMQLNFCGRLEKLYMLNPSSSLNGAWKMIKG